ncbi:MAG: ion channel [Flavisolibacter sp.]
MAIHKKELNKELTTGFGEKSAQSGGRFFNKDGKPNTMMRGINFFDQLSWYHTLLSMPQWKFWCSLLATYIIINCFFGLIYFFIGIDQLAGLHSGTGWQNFLESFFFSAQTFTTVGYGRVSPSSTLTSAIASFEAFLGVLSLALASGLFYGRFSKPRSFLKFSSVALISPYKNGVALMFRTVPYKNNQLNDAEIKLTLAMKVNRNGDIKNEFYPLKVEFNKINSLVLNWTIVHPINEESPIYGMSVEEMKAASVEVLAYLKAYDEIFANTVIARTSFTANEIIEGAKFRPMYSPSASGDTTVLYIDRLNHYDKLSIEALNQFLSE